MRVSDIEKMVAKMADLPEKTISASDKMALRNIEGQLKEVIFGQDKAITTLVNAIKMSRSGLGEPNKPVGSFLFSGPTGVGKTEVTRQLAELMGIKFIRFDMSEYQEQHTVARLIGAPPGYVGFDQGGLLTEALSQNPHCILLLDEIEKAHPDIYNLLLQVMDYGTLTDSNGRKADFRHAVLVMTTNIGVAEMGRPSMGFQSQDHSGDGLGALNRKFSPEFRNRLDAVIQFDALSQESIAQVAEKYLSELESRLKAKHVELVVDPSAKLWLIKHGYDKKMGARPMARLIQEKIKKPLAEELLFGYLSDKLRKQKGKITVHACREGGGLCIQEGDMIETIETELRETKLRRCSLAAPVA